MIEEIYSRWLSCGCRLTTDSRAVKGGEMFLALRGENFDGNDYALKALEDGAGCVVIERGSAASGKDGAIEVDDTLRTLQDLANCHRRHLSIPVIGLTGTNGKTTTKELIRTALSAKYRVTATEGNLNNDIGVPLSILKITSETQIAVIEMGANHPDDILHLVRILEPDAGLITNVGKAHLLGFGSFDGVKRAKGQLYDCLSERKGTAFVNADDDDLMQMLSSRTGISGVYYGLKHDEAKVLPLTEDEPFLRISLAGMTVKTSLVGTYNAANVLAALCVARHFNVPLEDAVLSIAAYVPSNNRSQMKKTESNVLIVDAYNANPSSMSAAITNFAAMDSAHKLALLGDMRELGKDSLKEHIAIVGSLQENGLDAYLVGEEFTGAVASTGASFKTFPDSASLSDFLRQNPVRDHSILVKGSRGIQMEKVIPEL